MANPPGRHIRLSCGLGWRLGALLALFILVWPPVAYSQNGPVAPCKADGTASYPAFSDMPNAHNWLAGDIAAAWVPAGCIGWAARHFTVLTALAGQFHFNGGVDGILAKFGAQSTWRGIKYWSVTDGRWDTLITEAVALDGADHQSRRADFSLPELKSGADLFFMQKDNRSADAVVYRMRVIAVEPDELIVTVENVSTVSFLIFTLFGPGDLESTYIFEKLAPTIWGYYSLSGARESAVVVGNHAASYLNRAAAIYRHLAGIPSDQEPPLAP